MGARWQSGEALLVKDMGSQRIINIAALLIAGAGVVMTYLEYLDSQMANQRNEQDDYRQAVANLVDEKPASVRLGILNLYDLSKRDPAKSKEITEILSAHLREATQAQEYKNCKDEPSAPIQFLMDKLSKLNKVNFERWKTHDIRLELNESCLNGADLEKEHLQGAYLYGAQLQGANLEGAGLQGADLEGAGLQGADLEGAQLQGAYLYGAQLQGAYLYGAQLQGANLYGAQLQGAYLEGAGLQGANLEGAQLQGANLYGAQLQGANLYGAQLQGANLYGAQLQGADLEGAQLQGTTDDGMWDQSQPDTNNDCKGGDTILATIERRIGERTGKETSLEGENVVFSGGLTKEKITEIEGVLDKLVKDDLFDEHEAEQLPALLRKRHTGPKVYEIPESASTGILTEKMVKNIIDEYKQSTMPDASEDACQE